MIEPEATPDLSAQMMGILRGNWITQMLYVAAELKLADYLSGASVDTQELAKQCQAHPAHLYRLLRALASIGVFQEESRGVFTSTPLGDLLRTSHPQSLRSMALMQGQERYWAWGDLMTCIKTGASAFDKRFGQPVFDWYRDHPEAAAVFDQAMAAVTASEIKALLDVFSLSRYSHLIDIGGGNGMALIQMLKHYPHLKGTLVDLPHVINKVTVPATLQHRFSPLSMNIFESAPTCGDIYLLKNVLHDWGDTACLRILESVRSAMCTNNADLVIFEQIIPVDNNACPGKLLDVNMLVVHQQGRERTLDEFQNLIHQAGLAVRCVTGTGSPLSLIEVEVANDA